MATPVVNPFVLAAGTFAAPLVLGTLGRATISVDKTAQDKEAELRSAILKFSLLNAAAAGLLAYGSTHTSRPGLRSVALGGAIGSALVAGVLAATALLTPKATAAPAQNGVLPAPTPTQAFLSQFVGAR